MYLSYSPPSSSNDPHRRYIPDLRTNNMITNLGLSRIEPTRSAVAELSYNRVPTDESPFNPVLSDNVQYTPKPYITNRNRVVSKYENNNPGNNNIALYDTHIYTLNAMNEPKMANNQMYNNLMARAREKVRLKETDLLPTYGEANSSNGSIYNPELPISETNIVPPHGTIITDSYTTNSTNPYSTLNLDPRLNQFTNERAWNYPSTKADIAYDLQRANYIKERNLRQHEADDALFRRTKKDRWVEPKLAYMNRERNPTYKLDQTIKKEASKQNERNNLNERKATEAFVNSRVDINKPEYLDAHNYNVAASRLYQNFEPQYDRHMDYVYANNIPDLERERFTEPEEDKLRASNAIDRITSTIKNIFKWNKLGNKDCRNKIDSNLNYDDDKNIIYHDAPDMKQHDSSAIDTIDVNRTYDKHGLNSEIATKERFIYKPDHVLVINDGKLIDTYPDDEGNNLATSAVFADKYNKNQIVRSIAMIDNDKFLYIRKLDKDAIFIGDHQRMGDDLITVELPIEQLSKKFRDKIKKYNTSTNRDKVIDLKYEDFVELNKWVEQHPDMQRRLKKEQLHFRVRTNDYDAEIVRNFGTDKLDTGRRIFVDNKVYNGLADKYRKRMDEKLRGRVDKDLYSMDVNAENGQITMSPISSSNKNSESNNYRSFESKILGSRQSGLKRGQFD